MNLPLEKECSGLEPAVSFVQGLGLEKGWAAKSRIVVWEHRWSIGWRAIGEIFWAFSGQIGELFQWLMHLSSRKRSGTFSAEKFSEICERSKMKQNSIKWPCQILQMIASRENTRSAQSFCLLLCRTNTRRFSVYFQGPKFYNSPNAKITKSSSYASFHRKSLFKKNSSQ